MKSKYKPFFPFIALTASVALSPLYAATIDTTGSTSVDPVVLAPSNTYTGDGYLNAKGDPGTDIGLIGWGNYFAMSGGLFTIESGVEVTNTWGVYWTDNKADMQIDGIYDISNNPVSETRVDALTGAGSINFHQQPWVDAQKLHVGLDNGSGTFSGAVQGVFEWSKSGVNIIKSGTGTQTFDNLANQPFRTILINEGVVNLSNATAVTLGTRDQDQYRTTISGAGNLTKSGVGVLTLNGDIGIWGEFTVAEGTVNVGPYLTPFVNLVIASGAFMNLNFAGEETVSSLSIGGSAPLPPGTYNSSHPTYGSYFTGDGFGTGTLKVLPPVGNNNGTWNPSVASGNWSVADNWVSTTVAKGIGQRATFSAISPVTATVDSNITIGQLVFDGANHSLASAFGASLTLDNDGTTPVVTVANGIQARISSVLASSNGLDKNGTGTLTLASGSSIVGGTKIIEGKLVLENNTSGGPNFIIEAGASLECNFTGDIQALRIFSNGSILGGGNLVKTGGSGLAFGAQNQMQTIALEAGSLIDVQAGLLRNEWGAANWGGNLADLNVESGAYYDIWDTNVSVDAITGAGIINKGWSGTHTFTFGVADSVANVVYPVSTFSGTISNRNQPGYGGNGGGTLNLVKTGVGTQAFTGSTLFRGALTVNQGTLSLGNGTDNTALPDTTPVTVATGAKLDLKFTGSDAVASVKLGDTTYDTPGDTFGFSNYPEFFTGSGTLRIAGDFETWASNSGLTGGADDDDDNDGVSNKEEYAFGLLPKDGSSVNPIAVQLDKTNASFSYTRRKTSLGTNLTYSVWFSTDLAGWTKDTGATEGALVESGDNETVPVTLSALAGNPLPGKLFIQVRAE